MLEKNIYFSWKYCFRFKTWKEKNLYTGNIDVWGILWANIDFSSYSFLLSLSFGFIQSAFNLMDESELPKKKQNRTAISWIIFYCCSLSYVHFSHCHKLKGAFILLSFIQSSLYVRVNDPAVNVSLIFFHSLC